MVKIITDAEVVILKAVSCHLKGCTHRRKLHITVVKLIIVENGTTSLRSYDSNVVMMVIIFHIF